jgi:hypothetical protein
MLRDKLRARLDQMKGSPDYQHLASEVLGIRGAPPELARRLVSQALVMEDRRDVWREAGRRVCAAAPQRPGVYVLRDGDGRVLYVGKAVNLRRRLRAHFSGRVWRSLKPGMSRVADAEWQEVGSDLEALLREAELIETLGPVVNVQRARRAALVRAVRDVIVVLPSSEDGSVELVCATAGDVIMMRTPRNGADLSTHVRGIVEFLQRPRVSGTEISGRAAIVFSWLRDRGASATRLHLDDVGTRRELRARLEALLRDPMLFVERLDQRAGVPGRARAPRRARPV